MANRFQADVESLKTATLHACAFAKEYWAHQSDCPQFHANRFGYYYNEIRECVEQLREALNDPNVRSDLSLANPYPVAVAGRKERSYAAAVLSAGEQLLKAFDDRKYGWDAASYTVDTTPVFAAHPISDDVAIDCIKEFERCTGVAFDDGPVSKSPARKDKWFGVHVLLDNEVGHEAWSPQQKKAFVSSYNSGYATNGAPLLTGKKLGEILRDRKKKRLRNDEWGGK